MLSQSGSGDEASDACVGDVQAGSAEQDAQQQIGDVGSCLSKVGGSNAFNLATRLPRAEGLLSLVVVYDRRLEMPSSPLQVQGRSPRVDADVCCVRFAPVGRSVASTQCETRTHLTAAHTCGHGEPIIRMSVPAQLLLTCSDHFPNITQLIS